MKINRYLKQKIGAEENNFSEKNLSNSKTDKDQEHQHIILCFDGVCGLCNCFVDLILMADDKDKFRFTAFQSEAAKQLFGNHNYKSQFLLLYYQDHLYEQSDAVIMALKQLGWAWKSVNILYIFPKLFRDFIYRFIANRRYRIGGKLERCRLPKPEEQFRFFP